MNGLKARGRTSSAALATVTAFPIQLLRPPRYLTEAQADVWRSVIPTKPADWWDAGSVPLLVAFCRTVVEHKRVSTELDAFEDSWLKEDAGLKRYEILVRVQDRLSGRLTSLATKMRLSQQSRYRADAADTANRKAAGERPWNRVIQG